MQLALVGLAVFLAACANSTADQEHMLEGRWHRAAEGFVSDPLQSLATEYLELRPQGVFVSLLFDQGPQTYWTTALGHYAVSGTEITISGKCWQGWQSYACSKVYRFELKGDDLTIFDTADPAHRIDYRRAGAVGRALPPTLAPPAPSPTPAACRYTVYPRVAS